MRTALALALAGLLCAGAAHAMEIPIERGSFENGGATYNIGPGWTEDQPRGGETGFAQSGIETSTGGLMPYDGAQFGRVSVVGDADPATTKWGTISTTSDLGAYQANMQYTLSFQAARNSYITSDKWFVLGGLRADGSDVTGIDIDCRALTDGATTGQEDTWYPVTVELDTAANPSIVGQTISVYLGMRHEDNYNKSIFFDDVTLTYVPEPATLSLLALTSLAALRRRW